METEQSLLLRRYTLYIIIKTVDERIPTLATKKIVLRGHIGTLSSSSRWCIVEEHKTGNALETIYLHVDFFQSGNKEVKDNTANLCDTL